MLNLAFLRAHGRLLGFGLVMALSSGFGQTFFISLFGAEVRAGLDLSHGGFGTLYSLGTLGSAALLVFGGRLIDRWPLALFAGTVLGGLALGCLAMSAAESAAGLALAIFGLRFFGQGLSSHASLTAMARYFARERGRAVAIASLGYPIGEAALPPLVVALLMGTPWRMLWVGAALILIFLALPGMLWLLKGHGARHAAFTAAKRDHAGDATLGQVLRDTGFWLRIPALLAPSFISTGLIFHQVHIAATKGWPMTLMAGSFSLYAVGSVGSVLLAGGLVDRFSARRLVPFFLGPLTLACLALAFNASPMTAPVFFALLGIGAGATTSILGSLWAELYGVAHLGAIRAFAQAAMVFSTGLAPAFMGVLIDAGVGANAIAVGCAVYCLGASALAHTAGRTTLQNA
jgi:MFS family permease